MLNALALGDFFLLDIETVPQFPSFSHLPDDWKLLWNEKLSKTMPETISPADGYTLRAGILAEFGKIICISTGYFFENADGEVCLKIKSISGHDEKALLESFIQINTKFFQFKKQFNYAGHNIKEFDIPYICRRMVINQVPLPEYLYLHGAKPWEVNMTDTMQCWKFGDYKNYISLNLLAKILDVPTSKTDMDGSMVQSVYYEENNLPRIVDYCQRDVVVVANVLLRFKNLPLLNPANIVVVE
ncbi:MAG TPA: ribonuclease H-like domain-containing protein [Chitinophagaceae bacterium]|nr:ribonuclease H-like domain-containing protein [Chitinophagaceae bacterium]